MTTAIHTLYLTNQLTLILVFGIAVCEDVELVNVDVQTVKHTGVKSTLQPGHCLLVQHHLITALLQEELVSNLAFMSCQPHRVTSGQSNSVISKCTLQNSSHA